MSLVNWLLLAALSLIWGGAFLFAKVAVAEIPPFVLVFFRVFSAACALHILLRFRKIPFPTDAVTLKAFLVMGFLNNAVPFSLIFWGQTAISAGLASILNAATPIFTVIVAMLVFAQEPFRANRLAGVFIGFAGVAITLSPALEGIGDEPLSAQLACLGAALSYALAATFAKHFRAMSPLTAASGQLTGSSIIMLPIALWQGGGWDLSQTSRTAWLNVACLGLLSTALAYLIYFRLLIKTGATNASLVTLLIPTSAIALSAAFLGEAVTPRQALGLGIILIGLVILDGRAGNLMRRMAFRSAT
ncbi:DMT family transporter [Rhizobiales bacterium]|uniref:DMT family transporter n=1 Tax=Hongsoonwoonella zoysiae TaxID=2821844 RepID=UPI0015604B5B|nr:DMT family transporter [Hongsoonwoonella zoysiae]NRG17399.1 DMT family transporter [Hongsoonwoonella zoysiae]